MYPRTLLSDSYLTEVYDTIPRQLEGIGQWYAGSVSNPTNRDAYKWAIRSCVILAKSVYPYDGEALIEALKRFKTDVKQSPDWYCQQHTPRKNHCPSTWLAEPARYMEIAVDQCIEVTQGIINKYLIHS